MTPEQRERRRIARAVARAYRATGFEVEVDHVVPLRSPIVSGLHVEHNLNIVPSAVNRIKNNKHDVA